MATADPVFDPVITPTLGALTQYLSVGMSAAGISAASLSYFWDDFDYSVSVATQKWAQTTSGSAGSTFPIGSRRGGWVRVSTGATAGSVYDLTNQQNFVGNSRTSGWYCAWRGALPNALDNQAIVGMGVDDGAQSVIAGFNGTLNAVNFSVQHSGRYAGSVINLGVAVDTSVHIWECWSPGDSSLYARMDGGTIISAAPSTSVVDGTAREVCHNGTTAAARTTDMDWYLLLSGRSP